MPAFVLTCLVGLMGCSSAAAPAPAEVRDRPGGQLPATDALSPSEPGQLTGTITTKGKPAGGAVVQVFAPGSRERPVAEVTSQPDGGFSIDLLPGDYEVLIAIPPFPLYQKKVTVPVGNVVIIQVELKVDK